LRAALALQPGSLTNALGTLRERSLVETLRPAGDKRSRAHRLTPEGRAVLADLIDAFRSALDAGEPEDSE